MPPYRVSVIIPSYKPDDYIWTCLDSINKQELDKKLFEVIIVLNGCKEPYETLIKNYISGFEGSWKVIQLDKGGVSNARNVGIENSNGEFIAFVDDDDFVTSSYLTELLQISSINTIGICRPLSFKDGIGEIAPFSLTKEFDKKCPRKKCKFYIPKRLFAGPCMKFIHRDIIRDRRFDTRFKNSEDSLFMFTISDRIKYAAFTSKNAIYYRRFRVGSAVTRKRSFGDKAKNASKIMWEESKIFWQGFPRYNFRFYITRLLGAIRGAIK